MVDAVACEIFPYSLFISAAPGPFGTPVWDLSTQKALHELPEGVGATFTPAGQLVIVQNGYTATTPDGRTFPGVRWLHDYLCYDPPAPIGGYMENPDYWPMVDADFVEATRRVLRLRHRCRQPRRSASGLRSP